MWKSPEKIGNKKESGGRKVAVKIRAKENICIVCGAVSDGRKLITTEKAGNVFQVDIPLCNAHKDTPDQDLIKALETTLDPAPNWSAP